MKKTFRLQEPGKEPRRVVERVREEVGKYVNREKRKQLPEGFDQWDFSCRVGIDQATAEPKELKQVPAAIDAVAATGAEEVFVEIVASARPRPAPPPEPENPLGPV